MDKFINYLEMMEYLFDGEKLVQKAARIVAGVIKARSPRITEIAERMAGKSEANRKMIHRLLKEADMKTALMRLYQEDAEFVIGDPTEMMRYKAPKTEYVGTLKDGETPGYWLLMLSTPFRGRAIPFHFITYSSRTINDQATSRNQEHFRAFRKIKGLLGNRPLVLDREFSYRELMEILVLEKINFVIRLNLGNKPPRFYDQEGRKIKLLVRSGGTTIHRQVLYQNKVKVNLIGHWRKGLSKPLWVITNLDPKLGLNVYQKRMKIEMTFRDCKDRLHIQKVMNKSQSNMEKMIALVLIAFTVGMLFGEAVRDVTYGHISPEQVPDLLLGCLSVDVASGRKWQLYSGFFILVKQKQRLPDDTMTSIAKSIISVFSKLVWGDVPSFVPT